MIRQRFVVNRFSRRVWSGREYSSLIRNPRWTSEAPKQPSTGGCSYGLFPPQQRASFVTITQTKSSDPPLDTAASIERDVESDTSSTPSQAPTLQDDDDDTTALIVTESCWARIEHLTKDQPDTYLRLFVDAGGCSGFTYQFELDKAALDADDDVIYTQPNSVTGVRLIVDKASLGFLQGATIDYVQEMIKSAFAVTENPQSESACGCGSSFALKNFAANPAMD